MFGRGVQIKSRIQNRRLWNYGQVHVESSGNRQNRNEFEVEDYEDLGASLMEKEREEGGRGLDSERHISLVESIKEISSTKRRPTKRKEAAKNVEEFVAVKRRVNVGDGGVNKFLESVKEAGEAKTAEKISKLISSTENSRSLQQKAIKTLDAPAAKITSDKVKRTVLYEHVKEEVSQWNSVVYHNRVADQLVFPLSDDKKAFKKAKKNDTEFTPITPLEEEIAKVLYGEDYVQRKKAEMAKDPQKTDIESYMLSVEEAMATHSEMAKLRALQSYAMAKAKRQNKIKSKKYHRLLRKSKIRKQMKEFEELQKKDPGAAMLKLDELERSRVQERMSLKHRNTTKWAKMHAARAKYDKDSRIALSEQLKISRDLTQKVEESSSSEDEEDMELPKLVKSSVENPWMLKPSLQENEKLQMYYTGYKKFWDDYNRQLEKKKSKLDETTPKVANSTPGSTVEIRNENFVKKLKNSNNFEANTASTTDVFARSRDGDANEIRQLNIDDEEINTEGFKDADREVHSNWSVKNTRQKNLPEPVQKARLAINPDNFLKITKSGASIVPQFSADKSNAVEFLNEIESSDDESNQRDLIAEAFEDDDVVSEFYKEKKETIEASQPQDMDNFLPGWGSWTGKGIIQDRKKKKRFTKKPKKGPPRKDAHISHVIINEEVSDKVKTHQVKEVPFPFTRVKDFEKSVRAPIGRTWMPEHAVKSLTAPKVITRLGAIIKPISEDVIVKPKQKKFHVPNTIIRMAKVTTQK